jgi:hypothetical protein
VADWTRLKKLCCQRHGIHDSGSQGRKVLMSVLVVSLAVWKKGYFAGLTTPFELRGRSIPWAAFYYISSHASIRIPTDVVCAVD